MDVDCAIGDTVVAEHEVRRVAQLTELLIKADRAAC